MSSEKRLRAPGSFGWYCVCGARQVVTVTARVAAEDAHCQRCGRPADVYTGQGAPAKLGGAQRLGKITSSVSVPGHGEGGSNG